MANLKMYYTRNPGWLWSIDKSPVLNAPLDISCAKDGTYKLKKVYLTLGKLRNSEYPIFINGVQVAKTGQIISLSQAMVSLTVEGKTSTFNSLSGTARELRNTAYINKTVCYNENSYCSNNGKVYEFVFNDPPTLKSDSKITINFGFGYDEGSYGITLGNEYNLSKCYWEVEDIRIIPTPVPSDPEEIQRESGNLNLSLSAHDLAKCNLSITPYSYQTNTAKAHNAFKGENKAEDLGEFLIENNSKIPLSQYFSLDADTNNKIKVEDDNVNIPYLFRFFNSAVQDKNNDTDSAYKKDLNVNLNVSFAPSNIRELSFDYRDANNNIIPWQNVPDTIIMEQEDISIANLKYANRLSTSGYCRAFRITFRNAETNENIYEYDLISEDETIGKYSNKVIKITDSNYQRLPFDTQMRMVITPYFYFNNTLHNIYSKISYVLPQIFIKIATEDLLPTLKFPFLNKTAPWSKILLPDVERFGYEFSDKLADNWFYSLGNVKFGVEANNVRCYHENSKYWASVFMVKRQLFDIGTFVIDKGLLSSNLKIRPFIEVMSGTDQIKRFYGEEAVLDTTWSNIWRRPVAKSGEYLTYYDAQNFMDFINKYRFFNNNEIWTVPLEMRGAHIRARFWKDIEKYLNEHYVKPMQSWVSEYACTHDFMHNMGFTHDFLHNFTHDEISGRATRYTIWQESCLHIWRGMHIYVERDVLTTHDYLFESEYTHDMLNQFTYDELKYKGSYNNLKENYYDLLRDMDAHNRSRRFATHNYLNDKEYSHDFLHEYSYQEIKTKRRGI